MANIHFIWWGPLPDDPQKRSDCLDSPVDVFTHIKETHDVIFWCQSQYKVSFETEFSRRGATFLRVKSCSSVADIVGPALATGDRSRWFMDAANIIYTFDSMRAYTPIKGLLSLIILYCYGGYYFETTAMIDTSKLSKYINEHQAGGTTQKRVPRIDNKNQSIFTGSQPQYPIPDKDRAHNMRFAMMLPEIDVWALFSPANDVATELMIKSCINRCNRAGVSPSELNSPALEKLKPHDAPIGGLTFFTREENSFVGSVVRNSVYDGLIDINIPSEDNTTKTWPKFETLCWSGRSDPNLIRNKYKAYFIDELGVTNIK